MEKEINSADGVISIIELRVYSIYNGSYSEHICPLPEKTQNSNCEPIISSNTFTVSNNGTAKLLDTSATDKVLYNDYDSMFEIKYPETDISVRAKLR